VATLTVSAHTANNTTSALQRLRRGFSGFVRWSILDCNERTSFLPYKNQRRQASTLDVTLVTVWGHLVG